MSVLVQLRLLASRRARSALYLAACVWANLLIAQPAVARYVLIGALLVGLMAIRPEGLFGKQVEIV